MIEQAARVLVAAWTFNYLAATLGYTVLPHLRHGSRVATFITAQIAAHQLLMPWVFGVQTLIVVNDAATGDWADVGWDCFTLLIIWMSRTWPDDEDWERKKRKAKETVKNLGHRLVVVPREA